MKKEININVKNDLILEMRYLNVYGSNQRAHVLSYGSTQEMSFEKDGSNDYIGISGHSRTTQCIWNECLIDMPSWIDFEFLSEGKVTLIHLGERTVIKIPAGPPTWQLKLIRPTKRDLLGAKSYVVVSDDKFVKELRGDYD